MRKVSLCRLQSYDMHRQHSACSDASIAQLQLQGHSKRISRWADHYT